MKPHTYTYLKKREDDSIAEEMEKIEKVEAESEMVAAAETSFGKVAYEWNNALLIAAERIWGEHGNSRHH